MDISKQFVTSINCMDGRVQEPVINYLKSTFGIDYVDMVTEAGPNKILAEGTDTTLINCIKSRVEVSVAKHSSKLVAIVGHYDCGGNPAAEDVQIKQIKEAIKRVKSWYSSVEVIGLWVDENWMVNPINLDREKDVA